MADIEWSPASQGDLQRLYDFIAVHSEAAAGRAIEVIFETVDTLAELPEAGRPWLPDTAYRELNVQFGARGYVVRYCLFRARVIILRVWHGLENHQQGL